MTLAMVLITFTVVILRYIYAIGWIWMQESYVWLPGIVFMLGAGYTLLHNGHVRVDIIYGAGNARYKAVIDLFAVSYDYVLASWLKLEVSREAGGLPGLYLLKTVIPAFCVLLGLFLIAAFPGLATWLPKVLFGWRTGAVASGCCALLKSPGGARPRRISRGA